jgi:hypothetical protein
MQNNHPTKTTKIEQQPIASTIIIIMMIERRSFARFGIASSRN